MDNRLLLGTAVVGGLVTGAITMLVPDTSRPNSSMIIRDGLIGAAGSVFGVLAGSELFGWTNPSTFKLVLASAVGSIIFARSLAN